LSTTVGENLGKALFHLRKDDEDLKLWADAICINQHDDVAKSSQVRLMGDIFKTADLTYVWLGPTPGDHDEKVAQALEAFIKIGNRAKAAECWVTYGPEKMSDYLRHVSFWVIPEEEIDYEGIKSSIAFGKMIWMDLIRTEHFVPFYE
jgi:hypothetical protein